MSNLVSEYWTDGILACFACGQTFSWVSGLGLGFRVSGSRFQVLG